MAKKTTAEMIAAFEAARQAKAARMAEIMDQAAEKGETLDEAQTEEYDGLEREVKSVDDHLKRLRALERANAAAATPVSEARSVAEGAAARAGAVRVSSGPGIPGVRFAQVAKCVGVAKGNLPQAALLAETYFSHDQGVQDVLKAAVAAGTTSNTGWAGNLVGDQTGVFADFIEFLRPQTIIGRFGADGIPALRRVPFRTPLIGQSSGGAGYWVGESGAKPLTSFDFTRTTLTPLKVANIAVITEELLRDSSPAADVLVRDGLAAALRDRGYETIGVDLSELRKAGGGPKCCTLEVRG